MNFIKRAFICINKKKAKNLIVAIIFFVVAVLILSGISIKTAISKTAESARNSLGANVTLAYDAEKAMSKWMEENKGQSGGIQGESIPLDKAMDISKDKHVKGFNFLFGASGIADNFTPSYDEATQKTIQDAIKSNGSKNQMGNLSITGAYDTSLLDVFTGGQYKLLEGQHIRANEADQNYVLVEEELAKKNNLKLGDTIRMHWNKDSTKSLELKIVGIYDAPPVDEVTAKYAIMNPVNFLFTSYKKASLFNDSPEIEIDSFTYYLDSPGSISEFKKVAARYVDMDKFKLDANDAAYKKMVGPLNNVSGIATGMVAFIIVTACVILALIITLSLRRRKQEFGILLAVGERKRRIVGQLIVETVLMMTLALVAAIPVSNYISDGMGNLLLQNQISAAQKQAEATNNAQSTTVASVGAVGNVDQSLSAKTIDKLDVKATAEDFRNFIIIFSLLVLVSVSIPTISILRLQPNRILIRQE